MHLHIALKQLLVCQSLYRDRLSNVREVTTVTKTSAARNTCLERCMHCIYSTGHVQFGNRADLQAERYNSYLLLSLNLALTFTNVAVSAVDNPLSLPPSHSSVMQSQFWRGLPFTFNFTTVSF